MSNRLRIFLLVLSGAMLGLSFPPVPSGVLALFAFVPFLIAFADVDKFGRATRFAYLCFFIMNLISLYWPGGFVHGKDWYIMVAGTLLLLLHPFFFCVPVLGMVFIRRHFGYKAAVILFPFLWVAFEFLHASNQAGFPWLILGNTQTYDLQLIQFASITGVYGISLWILFINVLAFFLFTKVTLKEWKPTSRQAIIFVGIIIILYLLPKFYGSQVLKREDALTPPDSLRVAIIQPDIDPFEKWTTHGVQQLALLQRLTNDVKGKNIDLVIWPETATPFYILRPQNAPYFNEIRNQVEQLNVNLLTGIPDIIYYKPEDKIPSGAKTAENGIRYDSFNSSMLLQPGIAEIQKYAKIILVPFAERVPFSDVLSVLNAAKWNFGLGGWGVGPDTTVFRMIGNDKKEVRFGTLICYESIYPNFVASFVRKGAQFLTVITNDSWWGNTSGAYQHKQFAVLRAIENRRTIVQCANGGVSCVIDPHGVFQFETTMYTQQIAYGSIPLRSDLTFYTEHGDWLAEGCLFIALAAMISGLGRKFYSRVRQQEAT